MSTGPEYAYVEERFIDQLIGMRSEALENADDLRAALEQVENALRDLRAGDPAKGAPSEA